MQCLTLEDAEALLSRDGFAIVSKPDWKRPALVLKPAFAARQTRIGRRAAPAADRLLEFVDAANSWLPSKTRRLLWIENWETNYPNTYPAFVAMRGGLGEQRSLFEAPGHLFDAFPYDERDQLMRTREHDQEAGILVGLLSLVVIGGWDGRLIASGSTDQVEFWEGNIYFYATERSRLANAVALLDGFGCTNDPM